MIYRYAGAALGAAAASGLARSIIPGATETLERLAHTLTMRAAALAAPLTADMTAGAVAAELAAVSIPALTALAIAAASRAAVGVRRVLSVGLAILAVAAASGPEGDLRTAGMLAAAVIIMNLTTGPLVIAPLSAASAALSVTSLRWSADTILRQRESADSIRGVLESLPGEVATPGGVEAAQEAAAQIVPLASGAAPGILVAVVALAAAATLLRP